MICAKCGEDKASDLYTQLAAANARIAELEKHFEQAKDKIAMMGAEIVRLSEGKEQAETQNKRMREALEMARPALVRADSDTSYIAHRYSHVLTGAKCPLTEDELLKTSGMCRAAEKAVKAALEVKP